MTKEQNLNLNERLGRVAVLYGGDSAEREISLKSGAAIIEGLRAQGVHVVPINLGHNPLAEIQAANVNRAFIALHGPGGEDGKIQALLEYLQIPYTGSGIAASALCMDKLRSKHLWRGVGLPTPNYQVLSADSDWPTILAELGGEVIVKPCHEGSSLGMARVDSAQGLAEAYQQARKYDQTVMVEQFIRGAEYTVAILGGKALPAIKLETAHRFYDFDAKYQADDTRYLCPCGLPVEREAELQALATTAFTAVGASGWGRVDIMADQSGTFFLLEANTVPGMTDHSLVPMAAKAAGLSFEQLVLAIVSQTLEPDPCL